MVLWPEDPNNSLGCFHLGAQRESKNRPLIAIDTCFLVTNVTPFYAESGGQIGDRGIMFGDNASIRILDTKKILNNFLEMAVIAKFRQIWSLCHCN